MTQENAADMQIQSGPFEPTWESLRLFECPEWFRDAKLAFWSHWGPQSVPMFGDWYARHMYMEGSDQYRQHWRVYGHPSKHGYREIIEAWKAERFDPEGLMQMFVDAGARYFVGQAMHHDNFDNFDSAHNPYNSVRIGPKKDICGLWRSAATARGLKFALTEHLGASFNWFATNKGSDKAGPHAGVPYDGNDADYAGLYYKNQGYDMERDGWYTKNQEFHAHWFRRIKDVIDKLQPDLLYSDGGVPFGEGGYEAGLRIVAHLYNSSAKIHGTNQAVYTQKDTNPDVYKVGVLDIERGQLNSIAELPWQTDTSVGDWFYNVKDTYKTPRQVLEMLVDIVSKNGNLAMNIPQQPDGTLDDECDYLLKQMALWMKDNSEGIHGTRPWEVAGEGAAGAEAGAFKEAAVAWTPQDFRFTKKGDRLYAFQMTAAEQGGAQIRSLALGKTRRVSAVRVLGGQSAAFEQTNAGLTISNPPVQGTVGPTGFAIDLE